MDKICTKCKKPKLFTKFSKNKSRKDGYESRCKMCKKDYQQENNKNAFTIQTFSRYGQKKI